MNSNIPNTKVIAGGAAGALVSVLVWVVSLFGLDIPAEVAGALVVLVTFATSYFVPESKGQHTAD